MIVKLGNLPQVGVEIKNIWNHQLVPNKEFTAIFRASSLEQLDFEVFFSLQTKLGFHWMIRLMSETDPPSQTTEIFTTNGRNKSKTIPDMAMNLRIESELVGGWATHLKKYARQFGSWNPNFRDENKQVIWNHHLGINPSLPVIPCEDRWCFDPRSTPDSL